jgi:hypothetical protein
MSTHDKFKIFCSNILISSAVVSIISCRYKRITKRLNINFWSSDSDILHSLYVGSYGRDTDIKVSDIDMLFRLPYELYKQYDSYNGNGQSALLQAVRESISNTYSVTNIGADGQVIVIPFNDGITFELVPAFLNKDDSYTFPNSNNGGSWKTTNPKPEISEIKNDNQKWNHNLKRVCRMARAWKDTWDVLIGGLLIDTLAYNFMKDWEYKDKSFTYYDWMTRDFFEYLKNQNKDQNYWYAPGSNQLVYRKGLFEYKALRCYNISLEACDYERNNQDWSANQKWREIYGTKFPN